MNIDTLLQAAEFLDRRDREAEHGYASNALISDHFRNVRKKQKSKKSEGSRTTHNELEKNRRAHLRNCLEKLKELVPLGPEASRHTTLGLLTKAERYIKILEDKVRRQALLLEQIRRENRYLRRREKSLQTQIGHLKRGSISDSSKITQTRQGPALEQIQKENRYLRRMEKSLQTQIALMKRRSLSECSTDTVCSRSTNLSTGSPSISESDEVDVIGYTSSQSDTDDYCSVQSSSDSGVAMSTSPLTLSEMEII